VATRVALLALAWLLAAIGAGTSFTVAATALAVAAYLLVCLLVAPPTRPAAARRLSIVADLAGMLALVAVPALPGDGANLAVLGLVVLTGGLRGLADQAKRGLIGAGPAQPVAAGGGGSRAALAGLFVVGAAAAVAGAWFGLVGAVWLVAMASAGCAAVVSVAAPGHGDAPRPVATTPVDAPATGALTVIDGAILVDPAVVDPAVIEPGLVESAIVVDPAGDVEAVAVAGGWPVAAPGAPLAALGRGLADLFGDRLARNLTGTLLLANACAQAGAVLLVPAWANGVLHERAALGYLGGAVLAGAFIGRLARAVDRDRLAAWFALAAGYVLAGAVAVVGFGTGTHGLPDVLVAGALAAAAALTGGALGAVTPGVWALAGPLLPPARRARAAGIATGLSLVAVPVGGLLGLWLAATLTFTAAVLWAAVLIALATLAPLASFRAWRHLDRADGSAVIGGDRPAAAGELIAVSLDYADGEWGVEFRSGRQVLRGRQAVDPAEALYVVDLLDVPGLREEVDATVVADQVYAREHADELRDELARLESRMAGMSTMVELSRTRDGVD
jgi:hypothetical protein